MLPRIQAPVALTREVDGFLVNRLQYALLMEAYRLVEACDGHGKKVKGGGVQEKYTPFHA